MRRIAFACLCLTLSGCGYNTWWNPPFTTGYNPNFPADDSENLRRVMGEQVDVPALTTEPGDVWPGPLPPEPTLQELEQQGKQPGPSSRCQDRRHPQCTVSAAAAGGSRQFDAAWVEPAGADAVAEPCRRRRPPTRPPARAKSGRSGVSDAERAGGDQWRHQRLPDHTTPGGGSAIVVPNGNGTSTIIHSDGTIETVPTPR